jgi:hypothetical protein
MTRLTATAIFSLNGVGVLPATVNFQFGLTADVSSSNLLAAANAIMTALGSSTAFKASMGPTTRLDAIRLAVHNPNTGPETSAATSTGSPVVASTTGTQPPPQVCIVASLRTPTPGRSFRGRLYWPPTGVTGAGTISTAQAAAVNAGVQAFAQQVAIALAAVGSNTTWWVWSPTRGAGTAITQVSVGVRADTQRRRNDSLDTYQNFPVT